MRLCVQYLTGGGGDRGVNALIGGRPLLHQQYDTTAGNVLSLA